MALATAGACGPSEASLCKRACDCEGCSSSEEDDCIDELEDAREEAAEEGCGAEYDALVSCIDEELECNDDQVEADGCSDEADDLADCLDDPVFFGVGDPCEALCDQLLECGAETCAFTGPCAGPVEDCASCLVAFGDDLCTPDGSQQALDNCADECLIEDDNLCTPGEEVFCLCFDGTEGTETCAADGQSFGPCSIDGVACDMGGPMP